MFRLEGGGARETSVFDKGQGVLSISMKEGVLEFTEELISVLWGMLIVTIGVSKKSGGRGYVSGGEREIKVLTRFFFF